MKLNKVYGDFLNKLKWIEQEKIDNKCVYFLPSDERYLPIISCVHGSLSCLSWLLNLNISMSSVIEMQLFDRSVDTQLTDKYDTPIRISLWSLFKPSTFVRKTILVKGQIQLTVPENPFRTTFEFRNRFRLVVGIFW